MPSIKKMNFNHLVGRKVGTVTLIKELARGGMAVIFIAYQQSLKRQIAVKILPKSILTPIARKLFQQEAESAAILAHPYIIPIYEVGEAEEFLFFTMQLVKGRTLSNMLDMAGKSLISFRRVLPVETSINIIIKVLDALAYAHDQDIIHRDIKPANVLIESHSQRPMITDFGIATASRGDNLTAGLIAGTPVYMAPEEILRSRIDNRTDIYATGVVLFEMLTSFLPLPPFKSTRELLELKLTLKERFYTKKPSQMNQLLDEEMDDIIFKALVYEPDNRYADCREFIKRLEAYLKKI